jgi:hypothetical protein
MREIEFVVSGIVEPIDENVCGVRSVDEQERHPIAQVVYKKQLPP